MAVADSKPLYTFISTGDKVAMYTLRMMCLDTIQIGHDKHMVHNDYYIQNLSNDKAKAETRAVELSEIMGLQFKGNADFELNEIRRQRDAMAQAQREAFEAARLERIEAEKAEFVRLVADGVMIMGKYTGQTCAEIIKAGGLSYLFWLAGETEARGKLGVCARIAADYIESNNIERPGFAGEIGDPITITVTLSRRFWTQGQFSSLMFICHDEQGREIVFFTVAKKFQELEIGTKIEITGTVKKHQTSWAGDKQTVINRPKMI